MKKVSSRLAANGEFILLMASLISVVAMMTDMILPALGKIGDSFNLQSDNSSQLVVTSLLIGMNVGTFIHGPLSDAIGRKKVIYLGISIGLIGTLLCITTTSFAVLLFGRFLGGFCAASTRIMVISMIRDKYSGDRMAQILSLVMTVFIVVPALSPLVGEFVVYLFDWRAIFVIFFIFLFINIIWVGLRQTETLKKEYRKSLKLSYIYASAKEVCTNRWSMTCAIAGGLVFGAFVGYVNTARQIFQDIYQAESSFPIYYSLLILNFGVATLINSKLLVFFKAINITLFTLLIYTISSISFMAVTFIFLDSQVPLPIFIFICIFLFSMVSICYNNFSAMAMEPMKHIAGMASSITGGISLFISIIISSIVGQFYDGSLLSLSIGYTVCSILSLILFYRLRRKMFLMNTL